MDERPDDNKPVKGIKIEGTLNVRNSAEEIVAKTIKLKLTVKIGSWLSLAIDRTKTDTQAVRPNNKFLWFGAICGVVLLGVFIFILTIIPCPTAPQEGIFKTILALAGAAFSITIAGVFQVRNRITYISGGFIIFLIIYFYTPASITQNSNCSKKRFKAIFFLNNKITKGIVVTFPLLAKRVETDEFGVVEFEYLPEVAQSPISISCKYLDQLDTIISLNKMDGSLHEFRLVCPN